VLGVGSDGAVHQLPKTVVRFFRFGARVDNPSQLIGETDRREYVLHNEDYVIISRIDPGDHYQLDLGLEYREVGSIDVEKLLVALDVVFSDGTVIPMRTTLDAKVRRRSR